MKSIKCPNCGAPLNENGACDYCQEEEDGGDFTSQIKATKQKNQIRDLQKGIDEEQYEIDKLLKDNPPNGCLKIGFIILFSAISIILAVLFFCRGDGYIYVIVGGAIAIPIVYAICKFCDTSGNEDIQKKIKRHKRNIKQLTQEIEDIKNKS